MEQIKLLRNFDDDPKARRKLAGDETPKNKKDRKSKSKQGNY